MERVDIRTPDITQENIEKIAGLFPDVVTESMDEAGNVVRSIDFDVLRQDLSPAIVEGPRERYQFTWPGKQAAKLEARKPCSKTMRPIRKDSVDWDRTENLYIEGDNLEALKIMRETYAGQVKLIYIDPPYNTGHDFIYDDDYSQTRADYELENGDFDEEGGRLVANLESNGRFHSDWCSMMYPRLLLARDLLSVDGAIFISIDDCEVGNLQKLCDDIFGRQNNVGNIVWERAFAPKNDAKYFSASHDFILVYAKCIDSFDLGLLPRTEEANARYKNPDNDPRGPWAADNMTVKTYSAAYDYPITTPNGTVVRPTNGRCWFTSKERMQALIEDGRVWFGEDGGNMPRIKRYLSDVQQGMTPTTIWKYEEVGHNQEGRQEVKKLFDGKGYFDGPKPLRLLDRILQVANLKTNSVVLDFFSGSSSMAHAVLQRNANSNTELRFIMVQLAETIDRSSDAYSDGYKNICEIGKERIRRAGMSIKMHAEKSDGQLSLQDENKSALDIGFRVLRIDSSNFRDTYLEPNELNQSSIFDYIDNLVEGRTAEDLLFQVMPKFRIPYSVKYTTCEIAGKTVFDVNDGQLVACFDEGVGVETIEAIAKMKPLYAVFRDASMADDATAANFEELFKTYSSDTIRKVI